jgi:cell division ATPase FtsA
MRLPFLHTTSVQSSKFLSININSKDVKCLALYYDSGSYKIIGYGREGLEAGSVRNGVIIDKEDATRALKSAVLMATENLEEKVNNAIIGVSGDLCLGLVTTVRLKRQTPLPFERKEIDGLYEKIYESARIQALNEYSETTGNTEAELGSIASTNVFTKVDGQVTDSLEGKTGTTAEAAVFSAFSPSFHIKSIQDIVKKSGLNLIAIGSEMYAISQWLRQYSSGLNDFVLLSIDNESTNAAEAL